MLGLDGVWGMNAYFLPEPEETPGVALHGLWRLTPIVREGGLDARGETGASDCARRTGHRSRSPDLSSEQADVIRRDDTFPLSSAPTDLSPDAVLRVLGFREHDCASEIEEHFPDWRSRGASESLPQALIASDGSEQVDVGGRVGATGVAILVTTPGQRRLFCACESRGSRSGDTFFVSPRGGRRLNRAHGVLGSRRRFAARSS